MIAIIDYGVGNLASVQNMYRKIGIDSIISSDVSEIENASKILLPGMGHFDNCMQRFNASGLRGIVEKKVLEEKTPLLGICVGLQMLMRSSEEGTLPGLNWIEGRTVAFDKSRMPRHLKVPNMGWLDIALKKKSALTENLQGARFYFAHSYHILTERREDELITAGYGYDFIAGVERENILGVQFHPEKSHRFGMQLFKNFAINY